MPRFDRSQVFQGGLGDFLKGYRQAENDAFEAEKNKRAIRDSDFAFGQRFRREGLEGDRLRIELDQARANLRRTELGNLNQSIQNRFDQVTFDPRAEREISLANRALLTNEFESRTLDDRISSLRSQAEIAATQASLEGDRIRAGINSSRANARNINAIANLRSRRADTNPVFPRGNSQVNAVRNTRPSINIQNEVNFVTGQIDRLLSQGDRDGASRLAQTLRGSHLDDNEYNRLIGAINNFQQVSTPSPAFGPFQN